MSDWLPSLQSSAAKIIQRRGLPFPVNIEVLDNVERMLLTMTATHRDNNGVTHFSKVGTLHLPSGDYTARFTAGENVFSEPFQVHA